VAARSRIGEDISEKLAYEPACSRWSGISAASGCAPSAKRSPRRRCRRRSSTKALLPRGFSLRSWWSILRSPYATNATALGLAGSNASPKMREGPLEVGLQEQASNHLKLRRSRAFVESVEAKRRSKTPSGGGQEDDREWTADHVSKRIETTSKPERSHWFGTRLGKACGLPNWRPAWRRR